MRVSLLFVDQFPSQRPYLLRRQTFVVSFIDRDHWRGAAGAEAFRFVDREPAIRRHLADAQRFLQRAVHHGQTVCDKLIISAFVWMLCRTYELSVLENVIRGFMKSIVDAKFQSRMLDD